MSARTSRRSPRPQQATAVATNAASPRGICLYAAAETLGVSRDELLEMLHTGKQKHGAVV